LAGTPKEPKKKQPLPLPAKMPDDSLCELQKPVVDAALRKDADGVPRLAEPLPVQGPTGPSDSTRGTDSLGTADKPQVLQPPPFTGPYDDEVPKPQVPSAIGVGKQSKPQSNHLKQLIIVAALIVASTVTGAYKVNSWLTRMQAAQGPTSLSNPDSSLENKMFTEPSKSSKSPLPKVKVFEQLDHAIKVRDAPKDGESGVQSKKQKAETTKKVVKWQATRTKAAEAHSDAKHNVKEKKSETPLVTTRSSAVLNNEYELINRELSTVLHGNSLVNVVLQLKYNGSDWQIKIVELTNREHTSMAEAQVQAVRYNINANPTLTKFQNWHNVSPSSLNHNAIYQFSRHCEK
jgi:hypothetical protein